MPGAVPSATPPSPRPTRSTRFMLDTNMVSFLIRGSSPPLKARLLSVPMAQLCVSVVTQGELVYGLARRPQASALRTAVRELLARLEVLPWDSSAAEHYGALRASLERHGAPLGNLDTLIAGHALAIGAVLVTNDQAFSRVDGLQVEDWTMGVSE
jgi:tRNA(fMet)-specific endonuclease VapC